MEAGNVIDVWTLEYSQISYEKNLEIPKIIFSVSFYVQLRELQIAITCVIQPSLYSFLLMFVSSFSLTSLVCRHSDLTLIYILRWQKSPRLFSLRIFFQHSQLLQLASFPLLYTLITQGIGNQILFFFIFGTTAPSGSRPPHSWGL